MKLGAPEWLLFLPVIALVAWRWPWLGLLRPLRAASLLLVVLILTQPAWRLASDGMDLWVLVDRSASAATRISEALPEWEALLRRGQGTEDRLQFVEFAASPVIRGQGEINVHDIQETRSAFALQYTLAQLAPDRLSRILLLGDGFATESLTSVTDPLLQRKVPLDYRLLLSKPGLDARVADVSMPQRVRPGESILVEATVVANQDGAVPFEVRRDGQVIGSGQADVRKGEARLRFTDRLRMAGGHRYSVHLTPAGDVHPENNSSEAWIEVAASARALVVSTFEQDPVADVLRKQGMAVEHVVDPRQLHAGSLAATRLVVLNNVPSHRLPQGFLEALPFYVQEQGGGLLMAGGPQSFGSGGYFSSAVDELLPVSMELRKEHRKLRVAMCLVLDRSGSMAVNVASAGGSVTKMDLANEGSARAIELLGDADLISVFAVDSEAHSMVPLTEIGPSRDVINDAVRRIHSQGGGIFVYQGLKAGWEELQKSPVGQKHLILFADAADAEEPGAYENLLAEMTAAGATVSVIGLGTDTDVDAAFLQDVAHRGKGRALFNDNASELPALFAQETVAIARSAFIEEVTGLQSTPGWLEIAARPLKWLESVNGYNLSYLRPGATAAALSKDEFAAPLVAFWQRGIGRSAAVSFPLAGKFSENARGWAQYTDCVTTITRWLAGEDLPAGLGLQSQLEGTDLTLNLFYDESAAEQVATGDPRLVLASREESGRRSVAWERLAPGHFQARVSLRPGETTRGAVQIGKAAIPFGPVLAGGNAEWQFRPEALTELRAVSNLTGGRERLDLATAWEAPPQERFTSLANYLFVALLLLVVADALQTRLGGFRSRPTPAG